MSQSIHFARIKCFSEEFTNELDYTQVFDYLKKILQGEENDESLEKLIVDIETEYLTLNAYDIEEFLKPGLKVQLHQNSRYYFVTEEVWAVLRTQIFKDSQEDIKEENNFFDIVKDCTNLESFYQKKMLVFEAS